MSEKSKSKALSIIAIVLASIGLVLLLLSIILYEQRSMFLSLGLACVAVSNLITTVWAKKKEDKSEDK